MTLVTKTKEEIFMKQVAIPRFCTWADVDKVAELSEKVLNGLADAGKSDYFGGVDADEIAAAMMDPSTVIVAEDERKDIIGFLLLQKPSEEEEEIYASTFPTKYRKNEGIIVNGIGVDVNKRKGGVATTMLEFGKDYALAHGFTEYIGTIHPKNGASENALRHISDDVEKAEPFTHRTRDGRDLLRQYFVQELI